MKNLFLIDGAAGSGKSDFFDFINEVGAQMSNFAIALPKYTSREKRLGEEKTVKDLIYFDGDEQERVKKYRQKIEEIKKSGDIIYEYEYPRNESYYAIEKSKIDKALKKYRNVYIIIRSSYCIRAIANTYQKYENINVVPIFIYSDKDCVEQRLRAELNAKYSELKIGRDEKERQISEAINKRLARTNIAMNDYYTQPIDIYKEVIINNSNKEIYFRQMRAVLDKYNDYLDLANRAFIIMPMNDETEEQHAENISIKNAIIVGARDAGFNANRADDIYDNNKKLIIQKVYENIDNSQICIVDLTQERPNCYLELGYARAKDKKIVLIAAYNEDNSQPYIHFDEQGYNCYFYNTSVEGLRNLTIYIQQEIMTWRKNNFM